MKRLFGLIGLMYLSVLAVVFNLYSHIIFICIFAGSVVFSVIWIILLFLKKKKNFRRALAVVSITALIASFVMILYTNFYYEPLINKYSLKEVNINGFVCDEVVMSENYAKYTIQTDTINGKDEHIKIQFNSYTDLNIDEFNNICMQCIMYEADSNSLVSDGIYFKTYVDDTFKIEQTGDKHFSLYSFAVEARKAMKTSLESLLPSDYSSICSAVLLGDKTALPQNIRNSFTRTGSSFLIVVSGMHMAVIASVGLFFVKKLTSNKFLHFLTAFIFVLAFMAVTGFTPSVVRSGIMIIIYYSSAVFLRTSDAINSLGIAALILLIPNPYAVGDVGLVLSFSATLGIILWSGKMYDYITSKLELKSRIIKTFLRLITASISAAVWVVPFSAIYFGRVSPLVLFVSVLVTFAVEWLIVCSLFASLLYLIPFVSFLAYPFALVCGLLSKYIIFIVGLFADIPYSSVNADKSYFYVWIAVSIILVLIGYMIKAKGKYVVCAVALSFLTLVTGSVVHMLVTYDDVTATVYGTGNGMTVAVGSRDNISLLCCGGNAGSTERIISDVADNYSTIDFLIIPNQKYKYSRYQYEFISEFDCSNVLVYDNGSTDFQMLSDYDGKVRQGFGNDVQFTLQLSDNAADTVLCIDGIVYQLIRSNGSTMLLMPSGADISVLPDEFRNVDCAVIDSIPKNYSMLNCKYLIYSNTVSEFKDDYNSSSEICGVVKNTSESDIIIDFKEVGLCLR